MRLVFFGSPPNALPSLEALQASRHPVLAVVTQPARPRGRGLEPRPSAVAEAARRLGLELLEPATLRGGFAADLRRLGPDLLVVVAYGKILPAPVLEAAPRGAVNLHASLLPRHRGASPVQAAILAGDPVTGVTTMQMDQGLDTGPMLLRASTPIGDDEDAGSLGERLARLGAPLLVETIDRLEAGSVEPQRQDGSLATYAPRIAAADGAVDWRLPAGEIARRVRALHPWPGAFTTLPDGRRLKLLRARAVEGVAAAGPGASAPGEVVGATRAAIEVACGEGRLQLLEAQPEGKRAMSAADLVNGRQLRMGERLGA